MAGASLVVTAKSGRSACARSMKERHRRVIGSVGAIAATPLSPARAGAVGQVVSVSPAQVQAGATRYQQLETGTRCQERRDIGGCPYHLLEVVQHQQQVLVAQALTQVLSDGLATLLA